MDSRADGDLLVAAIEAFERLLNDQTAGRKAVACVEKRRKNESYVEVNASAGMPPKDKNSPQDLWQVVAGDPDNCQPRERSSSMHGQKRHKSWLERSKDSNCLDAKLATNSPHAETDRFRQWRISAGLRGR